MSEAFKCYTEGKVINETIRNSTGKGKLENKVGKSRLLHAGLVMYNDGSLQKSKTSSALDS